MRKRIASIVLSVCLCLSLLPTAAFAEDKDSNAPQGDTDSNSYYGIDTINNTEGGDEGNTGSGDEGIKYLDASGQEQTYTGNYTTVASDTITWSDGWYVVTEDMEINGVTLTKSATVNLILYDGATLTVNGGIKHSFGSNDDTPTLNIYAQVGGTGALVANGEKNENQNISYGIYFWAGKLVVYGGHVTAEGYTAKNASKGISVKSLEVHGGTVTGTGNDYGINGSSLTLTSGTVKGKGTGKCGISVNKLNITGGTFIAEGSQYGLGYFNEDHEISITGGTFTINSSQDGFVKLLAENGYAFFENDKLVNAATATSLNNAKVLPHTCDFTPPESFDASYFCECGRKSVWYQVYDEASGKFVKKAREDYSLLENSATDIDVSDGWIVVQPGTTTINGSLQLRNNIYTNIILCDGATLIVEGGIYSHRDLTIYGGEKGTGKLIARNGTYSAGEETYGYGICISDYYTKKYTLTVHGGNITATGKDSISSSYGIKTSKLIVHGGTVTATGGNAVQNSYGIYTNNSGLTVSGGAVTVKSGEATNSGGIKVSSLTVSGGKVKLPVGSYIENELKVDGNVKLADLLPNGGQQYGFKDSSNVWHKSDSTEKTLTGATVKLWPIESVSIDGAKSSYTYGEEIELTAKVTQQSGVTETPAYEWFSVAGDGTETKLVGETTSTLKPGSLDAGTSCTYRVKAMVDDCSVTSEPVTFSVNKAKLSAPTFGTISESGKKLSDVSVTNTESNAAFAWEKGNDTEVKRGESYAWTLTPTDTTNYETLTGSYTPWPAPSSSSSDPTYSVTAPKADNGTVKVSPRYAEQGDTVTITVTPDEGYILDTLTVTDKNGNALELKDLGNGKYSFKMPKGKVNVEAAFVEDAEPLPSFADVPANAYYYDAVLWAAKNGVTGGVDENHFAPNEPCSRAQLVTFLWRAAGQPEASGTSGMTDVSQNAYYADAVAWAFENGIVGGYGNGLFGSDDTITREQMAVILYRFAQATGMDTTQGGMAVREYKDYDSISDYAVTAIQWAVNAGVMQGYDGNLMPGQPCTRAQIVTMLYRLLGE